MIPVSVIIVTKGVSADLEATLKSLSAFEDTWIVDSSEDTGLKILARDYDVTYRHFVWDGTYPKKRQWCLDTLALKHNWVFFIDADELATPELIEEITALFETKPDHDGYFIKGRYVIEGKICRFGLSNNKLCLFNKTKFEFPALHDLGFKGMGEIEGHYQPIAKNNGSVGRLRSPVLHKAFQDMDAWTNRHQGYAKWEAKMISYDAYPKDPIAWRENLKRLFRTIPLRAEIAFLHSYIILFGWLDGQAGYRLAKSRYVYYKMVRAELRRL